MSEICDEFESDRAMEKNLTRKEDRKCAGQRDV